MPIIVETARLILRTWEEADFESMAAIDQDPKVCEFLPELGTFEATAASISQIKNHYAQHGFSKYAVELKSNHELIGFVGLSFTPFDAPFTPCVEIGWRLASRYWSQGYATEAAKAVLHYAFTTLALDEIVSFAVTTNFASRRVMEKIGLRYCADEEFEHPKLEKNHPLSKHVLYRQSKMDYLKNNPFC